MLIPGPLSPADESITHQWPETFATVGTSDPAWTERVFGRAVDLDGEVSVAFGLSRYANRGVMDAYGAVSVGRTQWTVRGSRTLSGDLVTSAVGPLRYEVVEPLKRVRIVLEPNETQPISFDIELTGSLDPVTERNLQRRGSRSATDVTRYIQVMTADGDIDIAGRIHHFTPEHSFGVRDHSWGIRQYIGVPAVDRAAEFDIPSGTRFAMLWAPGWVQNDEGEHTSLFFAHWYAGADQSVVFNDVRLVTENVADVRPDSVQWHPVFDPISRELRYVDVVCSLESGSVRTFHLEVVGTSASCLGPALYGGFQGNYHGQYRGRLHVDGERIDDTTDPTRQPEIHQLRDLLVRITEPGTSRQGWGCVEVEAVGDFDTAQIPRADYR